MMVAKSVMVVPVMIVTVVIMSVVIVRIVTMPIVTMTVVVVVRMGVVRIAPGGLRDVVRMVVRRAGGMVRVRGERGGRRLRHVLSLRGGGNVPVASERCPA
nr:hypothetical protein [Acetobacter farinalis]